MEQEIKVEKEDLVFNALQIGEVTSGEVASATITGNAPNQVLNLVLPKGEKGDPGESGSGGGTLVVEFDSLTEEQKESLKGPQGEPGEPGQDGLNGQNGLDGQDGITPTIGDNGNWFIGDIDTGVLARGVDGKDGVQGPQGEPGKDGRDGIDGKDGTMTFEDLTDEQREMLRGPAGQDGADGKDGANGVDGQDGENGATFTPIVDEEGNLSWTNDKGLPNPETINIKGIQGEQGIQGEKGESGNTYTITDEDYQNIAEIAISKLTNAEEVKY